MFNFVLIIHAKGKPGWNQSDTIRLRFTYFITFLAFLFSALPVWNVFCNEYIISSKNVCVDYSTNGWRFCRSSVASHFIMVLCNLFDDSHPYLVFYHDYIEGRGVTSSIVGGWKFIEDDKKK